MNLLAIDPGNRESGYVVIDSASFLPSDFGKVANEEFATWLTTAPFDLVVIEQIGHYGTGMPAGRDIFDTCRWIGRFEQILHDRGATPDLVLRAKVKAHVCHSSKAKDSNVRQALVDRFAAGQLNHGKGTKAAPGWFHGFAADVWAAYALAVYAADTMPTAGLDPSNAAPGADPSNTDPKELDR